MANMILAYPNRADAATLVGGAWAATMPITNMQDRVLGIRARSADAAAASTWFDIQFPARYPVRVIALAHHTLSQSARYRVRGSMNADLSAPVYDSGEIDVWPIMWGDVAWEDAHWWDGTYTADEIDGYRFTLIHVLPAMVDPLYWRIELFDAANPAGYVDIGRLFIGDGWQPVYNMDRNPGLGFQSRTQSREAQSGTRYYGRRAGRRYFRGRLSHMDTAEAFGRGYEIQRMLDISGELLFIYDPADTEHMIRRSFLGTLRALSALEHPYHDAWGMPVEIEEIL